MVKSDFRWYRSIGRAQFSGDELNFSGTIELKVRADSLVFGRIMKLGFEGARGQFDEKGFILVNKLKREYIQAEYDDLSEKLGPVAMNFDALSSFESFISGDFPFELKDADFEILPAAYHLRSERDSFLADARFDKFTLKLKQLKLHKIATEDTVIVTYDDYKNVNSAVLPHIINVEIKGVNPMRIRLRLSNIELRKKDEVQFEIPSGYQEID